MAKKSKSFKFWTSDDVENTFGIERVFQMNLLDDWTKIDRKVPTEWLPFLEKTKDTLMKRVEYLNEEELKAHHLIPILDLIDFDDFGRYRTFLGRPLSTETHNIIISGVVDFMVATGKSNPEKPFFFLHEYKQELKKDNDPKGQLLIAMLAAKVKNGNEKPVYGCYIVGRFVFFVVFDGKRYCISKAYDMTSDDIFELTVILQKSKEMIIKEIDELQKK